MLAGIFKKQSCIGNTSARKTGYSGKKVSLGFWIPANCGPRWGWTSRGWKYQNRMLIYEEVRIRRWAVRWIHVTTASIENPRINWGRGFGKFRPTRFWAISFLVDPRRSSSIPNDMNHQVDFSNTYCESCNIAASTTRHQEFYKSS